MKRLLTACFLLLCAFGCETMRGSGKGDAGSCLENRAAFDIGSGSTRVKVAKVDVCAQRIGEVLFEKHHKVSYQEALLASPDGKLGKEIVAEGLAAIQALQGEAEAFKPKAIVAVATSAFRKAKNGHDVAADLTRETGIPIFVVEQREEGLLGFLGATQTTQTASEHLVVWDIGGGSQQITRREKDGQFVVYESQLASETFKNHVMKNIQGQTTAITPNPVSRTDEVAGRAYVREQLADMPVAFRKTFAAAGTEVLGIGGVHYFSVKGQVGSEQYGAAKVSAALQARLGWTDAQVGGEYPSTDVTNLILVGGVLEALSIKNVRAVQVNLTDGAMLYPRFWN